MSTISKVFIVLNLVLSMFLLGSVAALLAYSSDYKARFDQEVADHGETKTTLSKDKTDLQAQVQNLEATERSQVNKINDLESQVQTLESERNQERGDNAQLRNAVDGINSTLTALQSQVADLEGRNKELMDKNETYRQATADAETAKMAAEEDRARLENDVKSVQEDVNELQRQIAAVTSERDNLRAEREALVQQGVPLEDLIGNVVPQIEGTVSEIGPGFVVLSVGENDGVKIGYAFDVFRPGTYVGRVVVDKVFPDNSIARVEIQKAGLRFQIQDSATTRL